MAEETLNFSGEKRINIRTMKSDISAFLKDTKPSLIQLISTQAQAEASLREPDRTRHYLNAAAIGLASLLFLSLIGFLAFQKFFPDETGKTHTAVIPQPFFSVEQSATLEYERGSLRDKIRETAIQPDKIGTMKRIIVLDTTAAELRTLDGASLLDAAGIRMPQETAVALTGPVMIVSHKLDTGTRLGVVIRTSDAARAFEYILRNEPDTMRNWTGLFLASASRPEDAIFEDRDFRNIGYRNLTLNGAEDLHLIYGVFPAKQYLILATSQQTFQEIVSRLYEGS